MQLWEIEFIEIGEEAWEQPLNLLRVTLPILKAVTYSNEVALRKWPGVLLLIDLFHAVWFGLFVSDLLLEGGERRKAFVFTKFYGTLRSKITIIMSYWLGRIKTTFSWDRYVFKSCSELSPPRPLLLSVLLGCNSNPSKHRHIIVWPRSRKYLSDGLNRN